MAKQITVCPVADLPPGAVTGAGPYAIGNIDGKYFAVTRRCRHLRADLAGGSIEDGRLVCPWHQSAYDVENGQMVRGPPTDLREDPRTRNDVQDADESLASWTRHRIGLRQRHRRRITGACAIRLSILGTVYGPRGGVEGAWTVGARYWFLRDGHLRSTVGRLPGGVAGRGRRWSERHRTGRPVRRCCAHRPGAGRPDVLPAGG